MRTFTIAALIAIVVMGFAPAKAAQIINRSGPISDLFRGYSGEFQFDIGITGIVGPMSGVPGLAFNAPLPPISEQHGATPGPAPFWTYQSSIVHYTVKLTTPAALLYGEYTPIYGDWYDWYGYNTGQYNNEGGNDNSGGFYWLCSTGACGPANLNGNTATFGADAWQRATWGYTGDVYEIRYDWFNGFDFYGALPVEALEGTYNLQVFATNVPEPATWAMMLIGFGFTGIALRNRKRPQPAA
jgi:hypothetical protein